MFRTLGEITMKRTHFIPYIFLWLITGHARADFPVPTSTFFTYYQQERLGYCLSSGGDINNDGYDDFLIGTFHFNIGGWDRGAVYVKLGGPTRPGINTDVNSCDARFVGPILDPTYARTALGNDLSHGDINGDGYSDILMGAVAGGLLSHPGFACVVFGKSNVDWGMWADPWALADIKLGGQTPVDLTGASVAVIGDMNGDGCDEFIVSAPLVDTAGDNNRGVIYFFRGKATGWTGTSALAQADAVFTTNIDDARIGYWVSEIGDVNDDGIPDFAMSSWQLQRVFIFFGRASMDWGMSCDIYSADVIIAPASSTPTFGWMISKAGDVNGDGIDDILFSDETYDSGRGIIYLFFGRTQFNSFYLSSQASASYFGETYNVGAGFWISDAGDINYDGCADILVGAFRQSSPGHSWNGKAYLIYGKQTGWQRNVNLNTISTYIVGETDECQLGESVCCVGDMDGDGAVELAVAAPYYSGVAYRGGKVYLFYNTPQLQIGGYCTYTNTEAPIRNTAMHLTGDAEGTVMTGEDGAYVYHVSGPGTYHMTPSKLQGDDLGADGLTSYDAALVALHQIGTVTLQSDELDVADVDMDGSVTLADAISIARIVVGMPNLSGVHAGEWVFTPAYRDYINMTAPQHDQNYTGLLLGDTNMSWNGPGDMSKNSAGRGWITLEPQENSSGYRILKSEGDLLSCDLEITFSDSIRSDVSVALTPFSKQFFLTTRQTGNRLKISLFSAQALINEGDILTIVPDASFVNDGSCIEQVTYRWNDSCEQNGVVSSVSDPVRAVSTPLTVRNSPNPFNSSTSLFVRVAKTGNLRIEIFNLRGERIRTIADNWYRKGTHRILWDGRTDQGLDTPSGIYFCRTVNEGIQNQIKLLRVN